MVEFGIVVEVVEVEKVAVEMVVVATVMVKVIVVVPNSPSLALPDQIMSRALPNSLKLEVLE